MPQKIIILVEYISRLFPYALGLSVSVSIGDIAVKILVTCVSMLAGALFVHYLKPIIIKRINRLKKN